MDIQTFINNYYEAFSLKAELPIAFWYSDSLLGELKQTQGCLFKALPAIRQGEIIRYLHFARIDRLTSFPWFLRSLGPTICGKQLIKSHDPDVTFQDDVSDNA